MKTKQIILSRGLPKTGAADDAANYNDGYYQAGWWKGLTAAANRTRFIAITLDGDDVVIDRATGLMWAADGNEAGCNNGNMGFLQVHLPYANGLTFAGFSDWRVPNIFELFTLLLLSRVNPCIDTDYFTNTQVGNFWSSTYIAGDNNYCGKVDFTNGDMFPGAHTTNAYLRCVRGGLT